MITIGLVGFSECITRLDRLPMSIAKQRSGGSGWPVVTASSIDKRERAYSFVTQTIQKLHKSYTNEFKILSVPI